VLASVETLQELDLANNGLSDLPIELASLKKLTKVVLTGNTLSSVPACVLTLPMLEVLHLEGNDIKTLPAPLFATRVDGSEGIKDLRYLENPITTPPLGVLEGGIPATRAWYKEQEGVLHC